MKHKLFYLIGVATLLCSTSTFTSCINGVDDEYLDQKITDNGSTSKDDENTIPDINGDYSAEGDYDLQMTYNGEKLGGKKVIVQADEKFEKAMFTLAGTTKDLSAVSNLLEGMGATFTTYSPVPGEKEVVIDVNLYRSGKDFRFKGAQTKPTYSITYKGQILDDVMTIDITHKLVREENEILGAWKMGAVKEGDTTSMGLSSNNSSSASSPLWLDWASNTNVNMGSVETGVVVAPSIKIDRPMNGIFNLLMSADISKQLLAPLGVESTISQMIQYVATEETGGMYASYAYTAIGETPQYSQEMSHNIIRYYFDKEDPKVLRIEADADYLLTSLGGLLGGVMTRSTRADSDAQPDNAKVIGKELVDKLRPALEKGIPCEYKITGNDMAINIEGKFLKDLMISIGQLVNDPFVKNNLYPELDKMEGIGQYKENIKLLLQNFPKALGEDCAHVKLGFNMVKTTPQE